MLINKIDNSTALAVVEVNHYLHRRVGSPKYSYGLYDDQGLAGVIIFTYPAIKEQRISACPPNPEIVLELSRLWVDDRLPHNSESWFVSRALKALGQETTAIVISYADTGQFNNNGVPHLGYVYRATNFYYAGWTDADQNNPRYDYYHSNSDPSTHSYGTYFQYKDEMKAMTTDERKSHRKMRSVKARYWTTVGPTRTHRNNAKKLSGWLSVPWSTYPPPTGLHDHKEKSLLLRPLIKEAHEKVCPRTGCKKCKCLSVANAVR